MPIYQVVTNKYQSFYMLREYQKEAAFWADYTVTNFTSNSISCWHQVCVGKKNTLRECAQKILRESSISTLRDPEDNRAHKIRKILKVHLLEPVCPLCGCPSDFVGDADRIDELLGNRIYYSCGSCCQVIHPSECVQDKPEQLPIIVRRPCPGHWNHPLIKQGQMIMAPQIRIWFSNKYPTGKLPGKIPLFYVHGGIEVPATWDRKKKRLTSDWNLVVSLPNKELLFEQAKKITAFLENLR